MRAGAAPQRILAVGDSDSYVKWGAFLVDRMPHSWAPELAVLATPWQPSAAQLDAALTGTRWQGDPPPTITLEQFTRRIAEERPDAVLLAVRGPSVKVVHRAVTASGHRPVVVSGLPGISFPATWKAIAYRAQADLVVVHSRREVASFEALAERMPGRPSFALASLPFVVRSAAREPRSGGPLLFAVQAKFPAELEDRERLALALVAAARRHPERSVIVKVRAAAGEMQTHLERHDLGELVLRLDPPPNLAVQGGPMAEHLARAAGLVTVSSTALLEAIGAGVPVLALSDFGIRRSLVNTAFVDGGFLGTLQDLEEWEFRHPAPAWLEENWFHDPALDDWVPRLERLVAERDAGILPVRVQVTGTAGGALRRAWDRKRALGALDRSWSGRFALAVGTPTLRLLLLIRSLRRGLRRGRRPLGTFPAAAPPLDGAPVSSSRVP
ncbi:MAG: hypothetical protein HY996_08855 [Micrococcales bacterium]|nr:hypothetical protein [Micrococcales bacterium]